MEKAERGGKPRHAAVVAADMQPRAGTPRGDERADGGRIVAFGRTKQRDGAGMLGKRPGKLREIDHVGRGV
jgi:hypothetical protein